MDMSKVIMVQPWYVKIMKFAENSPLLARNGAQNRKFASLTRIAPQIVIVNIVGAPVVIVVVAVAIVRYSIVFCF